jgi:predicted RNA-binding Zn ribbon-like protein
MADGNDPFDWSGGHPALDFVNTLDERPSIEPIERLEAYSDLVRFTELAGLVDRSASKHLRQLTRPGCARIVSRARALREQLHGVLAAWHQHRPVSKDVLRSITLAIHQARASRRLVIAEAARGIVRYDWISPPAADVPLHACALAIEDLLVGADPSRMRKCGASDCGVYFIDTSKGRRRLWCSMSNCGNREKQRRWRSDAA